MDDFCNEALAKKLRVHGFGSHLHPFVQLSSSFPPATFQVLKRLMAVALGSTDMEHFYHLRKFRCIAL